MDEDIKSVSQRMLGLGLGALQHANWHANYYSHENAWWSELSVLQAAHAAEILIKARIAQEHPLLVFDQIPKNTKRTCNPLAMEELSEKGRSIQFADLPDRLWACTRICIPNIETYNAFGKLRNKIQHFAVPLDVDTAERTLEFIYDVIDPFIFNCWGLYAIDFNEDHEPYEYLIGGLIRREIAFLISPGAFELIGESDWTNSSEDYQSIMNQRFIDAGARQPAVLK